MTATQRHSRRTPPHPQRRRCWFAPLPPPRLRACIIRQDWVVRLADFGSAALADDAGEPGAADGAGGEALTAGRGAALSSSSLGLDASYLNLAPPPSPALSLFASQPASRGDAATSEGVQLQAAGSTLGSVGQSSGGAGARGRQNSGLSAHVRGQSGGSVLWMPPERASQMYAVFDDDDDADADAELSACVNDLISFVCLHFFVCLLTSFVLLRFFCLCPQLRRRRRRDVRQRVRRRERAVAARAGQRSPASVGDNAGAGAGAAAEADDDGEEDRAPFARTARAQRSVDDCFVCFPILCLSSHLTCPLAFLPPPYR